MLNKLSDIWIMSKDGIVIFNSVGIEKVDNQLFGGFLSAINTFAKEIDEDGMSGFDLGKEHFIFRNENPLLFIASYKNNINQKGAKKELDSIIKEFYSIYSINSIKSWNGDVSQFELFNELFDKRKNDIVDKFKESLWS